jgi:type III restriction enzyme
MSAAVEAKSWPFGIAPNVRAKLMRVFDDAPNLQQVFLYGSRARGDQRLESDIDLAVHAPEMTETDFVMLKSRIEDLGLIYRTDVVNLNAVLNEDFRARIEKDSQVFWQPHRAAVNLPRTLGLAELKDFQTQTLAQLDMYLAQLATAKLESEQALAAMAGIKAMERVADMRKLASDFPKAAWDAMRVAKALPESYAERAYSSRFDGADRPIPNICLKVPTGGGKTLLAAASVGKVFEGYLRRATGLVLWVVPNEAIYRQTLKTLSHRDHPYRQMLNVAGAGRVKILEKDSPLSRLDVDSHLCVMVLMLAAAARQNKETLRFFRDRGNVHGFLPREDDIEAHWSLLGQVPNLNVYGSPWASAGNADAQAQAVAQKGSIIKSSLGNVMRLVRPMVVIDEGHHGYTENALRTIDGFNPCFMLELSATPRVVAAGTLAAQASGSNILVDVRGTDLDRAEMIKMPIHVDVRSWADWQSCLAASVDQLALLGREADVLRAETDRYIRPILLVQVERTGKDQVDAGYIHAQHVREFLAQLGFTDKQIREKTSEKDELGDDDLLSPTSDVRVIITKQALQEGWDCPFAYVLCALAASKGKRALTQLVGRILRLPHVAKTGHAALDACYVFCHDATTGEVVKAIKQSLEVEGMGDLALSVKGDADAPEAAKPVPLKRRAGLEHLRIFLPTVTWAEPSQGRRALVYESDVLARLPWHTLDVAELAKNWKPGKQTSTSGRDAHLVVDLTVLQDEHSPLRQTMGDAAELHLDKAHMVRSLLDIHGNAWQVWTWVDAVASRCLAQWDEALVAASVATLIEELRKDLERLRDAMAQTVFEDLVKQGRIEFVLRADTTDYELPHDWLHSATGKPRKLLREDGLSDMEKSLLVPALQTPDMNEFEAAFAGYLDEQTALRWWHRNVAKTQYGLQGWKRHKVYPDFVFGFLTQGNTSRVALVETKGVHLANQDSDYKASLLAQLTQAFCDARFKEAGDLSLEDDGGTCLTCGLVFDQSWRADMDRRFFGA